MAIISDTPRLSDLPPPPTGKRRWPWTDEMSTSSDAMEHGKPWPRITVVTPSYNQGEFIEETIRSVLLQGYPNLEYIVMDGGSTDESIAIVRKYEPWLAHWESVRDRGQSHAINKGLALATGPIFNWINSDDLLTPNALLQVALAFEQDGDSVAGNIIYFGLGEDREYPNANLTPLGLMQNSISLQQPSLWLKTDYVVACGGINERFQYAFDWDLTIRYLNLFPKVTYISSVLSKFRLHEDSKTVSHQDKFSEEMILALEDMISRDDFAHLNQDCKRVLRSRQMYRVITSLRHQERGVLLRLLRLAIRNPDVLRLRFFWGAILQSL